jgi:hypothetical protein
MHRLRFNDVHGTCIFEIVRRDKILDHPHDEGMQWLIVAEPKR